jgi:hypothetical protein
MHAATAPSRLRDLLPLRIDCARRLGVRGRAAGARARRARWKSPTLCCASRGTWADLGLKPWWHIGLQTTTREQGGPSAPPSLRSALNVTRQLFATGRAASSVLLCQCTNLLLECGAMRVSLAERFSRARMMCLKLRFHCPTPWSTAALPGERLQRRPGCVHGGQPNTRSSWTRSEPLRASSPARRGARERVSRGRSPSRGIAMQRIARILRAKMASFKLGCCP